MRAYLSLEHKAMLETWNLICLQLHRLQRDIREAKK